MGQRLIHTLESDVARVQEALESVKSPLARASLASVVESLQAMMADDALDVRLAAHAPAPGERPAAGRYPMFKPADWF